MSTSVNILSSKLDKKANLREDGEVTLNSLGRDVESNCKRIFKLMEKAYYKMQTNWNPDGGFQLNLMDFDEIWQIITLF